MNLYFVIFKIIPSDFFSYVSSTTKMFHIPNIMKVGSTGDYLVSGLRESLTGPKPVNINQNQTNRRAKDADFA